VQRKGTATNRNVSGSNSSVDVESLANPGGILKPSSSSISSQQEHQHQQQQSVRWDDMEVPEPARGPRVPLPVRPSQPSRLSTTKSVPVSASNARIPVPGSLLANAEVASISIPECVRRYVLPQKPVEFQDPDDEHEPFAPMSPLPDYSTTNFMELEQQAQRVLYEEDKYGMQPMMSVPVPSSFIAYANANANANVQTNNGHNYYQSQTRSPPMRYQQYQQSYYDNYNDVDDDTLSMSQAAEL
jgi:hypothetical protein